MTLSPKYAPRRSLLVLRRSRLQRPRDHRLEAHRPTSTSPLARSPRPSYRAEPYAGGQEATLVGSRIALDFAKETGSNFLSPNILAAVRSRLANPEPDQMFKEERLWADLLSSMPLCFNLFGELRADAGLTANALRAWWPDAPTGKGAVRFEHSPGRRDPFFLGNKSAFDVAFEIEKADGTFGIIGVETKYHEHAKPEAVPKPKALARYTEVTERSGLFKPDWRAAIVGTELHRVPNSNPGGTRRSHKTRSVNFCRPITTCSFA
ncbi:MAG: hypothetical protein IPM35_19930 [Myxococcales bacterium]|nr:hypothetical protein [Myxococcales bacterium]